MYIRWTANIANNESMYNVLSRDNRFEMMEHSELMEDICEFHKLQISDNSNSTTEDTKQDQVQSGRERSCLFKNNRFSIFAE